MNKKLFSGFAAVAVSALLSSCTTSQPAVVEEKTAESKGCGANSCSGSKDTTATGSKCTKCKQAEDKKCSGDSKCSGDAKCSGDKKCSGESKCSAK